MKSWFNNWALIRYWWKIVWGEKNLDLPVYALPRLRKIIKKISDQGGLQYDFDPKSIDILRFRPPKEGEPNNMLENMQPLRVRGYRSTGDKPEFFEHVKVPAPKPKRTKNDPKPKNKKLH